ncbi:hypothetical protein GGR50DRAFT_275992 [Xylaria sp. CBS 124048]|nr:hypothetical protein GGR50DRAFT_275992 [Xylaria sp. CBS 124048]
MSKGKSTSGHGGDRTEFIGSQVGGKSVINYCYTDMPWRLVAYDIRYFFTFSWALPWIIWPLRPCDSGPFDELSLTAENVWCIFIHLLLALCQLAFLLLLPVGLLLPVYLFIAALAAFFLINWLLCRCLNGSTITYESDPKYAPTLAAHEHEQWIFLNGVAVGEAWMKSNINRLALTFKRPVLGIHNRTNGIVFDVIECLIQRNFSYATKDVRVAYKIIKEKLYNPQYSKVIFILHSQGGIEGGLVLDWLLQELAHDLLAKLEVYTFGNAANHFNNPHRHIDSQAEQKYLSAKIRVSEVTIDIPLTDSPVDIKAPPPARHISSTSRSSIQSIDIPQPLSPIEKDTRTPPPPPPPQTSTVSTASTISTISTHGRAIGHVEHYAHTTDFVALWGLLHFVTNERASPEMPRFMGRVFKRVSSRGGHQFCQHYLDGMFPLSRNDSGEFTGCADSNDFMEGIVEIAKEGTEMRDVRECIEKSWAMMELAGEPDSTIPTEIVVHGSDSGSLHGSLRGTFRGYDPSLFEGRVKVKHLSRLWQYRNGGSPSALPRGMIRELTI